MEVAICKDSGHGSEYLTQIMRLYGIRSDDLMLDD